ncbi:MAG: tetratricopeptide repeat protein [Candidatus Kapaibacteriota bacterium]
MFPSFLFAQVPFVAKIDTRIDKQVDTIKLAAKAIKAWEADKHKEAVTGFDAAIKQYPKVAELYALRGLMKYYSDQEQAAMKDMVKSFELSPQGVSYKNMLNYAFIATYSWDTTAALETFNALLKRPDSLEKETMLAAYIGRGQIKAMMKNYDAALEDYNAFLNKRPTQEIDIRFLALYVWTNWFLNKFSTVIDASNTILTPSAIQELGGDLFANVIQGLRGASKFYQKDYVGCIEDLTAIGKVSDLVFYDNNGEPIFMLQNDERNLCLAHSYLMTNNYAKAEKIYKAEIKKSPTFAATLRTDLQKLQEYGVKHPDFAKVEALLSTK